MWNKLFSIEFQRFVNKKLNTLYMHRNLRYYETIVQLLYLSGKHLPLLMIIKQIKWSHWTNSILKYIGMKYINILKGKCHVGITVAFLELILKLFDVCFMKNIFIAPWICLHHFDLHIIIRLPENVDMFTLLYFVLFFSSWWQSDY